MRIYIPSAGRYSPEHILRGPLVDIPISRRDSVVFVVPGNQFDEYWASLESTNMINQGVTVVGHDLIGIAPVRTMIGHREYALNSDGVFMMLDDDIRFYRRKDAESTSLIKVTSDDMVSMLSFVEICLRDYAHVGISAREGNNRAGVGDVETLIKENTRTMRALAYRTRDYVKVIHGRVQVMEDFDTHLQLLRMGLPNASINFFAQDQRKTNESGGCSDWRTHEVHENAAKTLAQLHPEYVRLRQKSNKTDKDGFGTRTEVTIQWKRAYNER